jgi:hypothetical protein
VAGIVTLACLIVLVTIAVRIWRRPAKPIAQEVEIEEVGTDTTSKEV